MQAPSHFMRTCPNCRAAIPAELFSVHIFRCYYNDNQRRAAETKEEQKAERGNVNAQKRQRKIEEKIEKKPRKQKKEESTERIPCHACGYNQTLKDLDTHFKKCPGRQAECSYCHYKYPQKLMVEHKLVCVNRPKPEPVQRNQERPIELSTVDSSRKMNMLSRQNSHASKGPVQRSQGGRIEHRHNVERRMSNSRQNTYISKERRERGNHQDLEQDEQNLMGRERMQTESNRARVGQLSRPRMEQRMGEVIQNAARRVNEGAGSLTSAQIELIPSFRFDKQKEDQTCSICYLDLEEGDIVKDLNCRHLFHTKCISQWLRKNKLCPLCKADTRQSIRVYQRKCQQPKQVQKQIKKEPRRNCPAQTYGEMIKHWFGGEKKSQEEEDEMNWSYSDEMIYD